MSTNWWLTLAERAAMRRAQKGSQPNETAPTAGTSHASRWRSQRPFNRPEFLTRRLRVDGLTEAEFDALVDTPPPGVPGDAQPPEWARDVERADAIAREIAQLPGRPVTGSGRYVRSSSRS